jgi:hypothetical protein
LFRYTQPIGKAQASAIAQAYMDHLVKTHSRPSTATQPRVMYVPPRPSWPARAIMRARKWRLPAINEGAIVLATLMIVGTGAVLHGSALV